MRFIEQFDPSFLSMRGDFYDHLAFVSGELSAPEWIPSGAASAVESGFLSAVPRETGPYRWSACLDRTTSKSGKPKAGGRRPGAGRKPLDPDGTIVTTVRLTAKQRATFDLVGGKDWLRGQLDLFGGD